MKSVFVFSLVVLAFLVAGIQEVAAGDPPDGVHSHFVNAALESVDCRVEQALLVELVCPSYLSGEWQGPLPCGFEPATCAEEEWQMFLAEQSLPGDFVEPGDCLGVEDDLETTMTEVPARRTTGKEEETLEMRVQLRLSAETQDFCSGIAAGSYLDTAKYLWLTALQALYVAVGCASELPPVHCQDSEYAEYLSAENSEAVVMRNPREAQDD